MEMVRHDYELMQQVGCFAIVIQSIDQQLGPTFFLEERPATPSRRRDHVGLAIVRRVLSGWSQASTSAAKAASLSLPLAARLEGAPFQSYFFQTF